MLWLTSLLPPLIAMQSNATTVPTTVVPAVPTANAGTDVPAANAVPAVPVGTDVPAANAVPAADAGTDVPIVMELWEQG